MVVEKLFRQVQYDGKKIKMSYKKYMFMEYKHELACLIFAFISMGSLILVLLSYTMNLIFNTQIGQKVLSAVMTFVCFSVGYFMLKAIIYIINLILETERMIKTGQYNIIGIKIPIIIEKKYSMEAKIYQDRRYIGFLQMPRKYYNKILKLQELKTFIGFDLKLLVSDQFNYGQYDHRYILIMDGFCYGENSCFIKLKDQIDTRKS